MIAATKFMKSSKGSTATKHNKRMLNDSFDCCKCTVDRLLHIKKEQVTQPNGVRRSSKLNIKESQ